MTVLGRRLRPSPDRGGDTELIRSFARRDTRAADELYARYAPRVFGLGMVMLGDGAQSEDLVQDTFVKVWRKADAYEPSRGSLDTWVLLIARSLAIDLLRRRVLDARILRSSVHSDESRTEQGPDEVAETVDMAGRARRAMASLSATQRAALELAYFGGKTSAEVAELEGIPVGTAKTRIRTALIRLRDALEANGDI